jgi:hypothetical protein
MTNTELARQIVANLEAERDDVLGRLAIAETFLAALTGDQPAVEIDAAPEAPPPKKAAAKPKSKAVTCPDCGQLMGSAAGLGIHRKHKHPQSAAKPVTPSSVNLPMPVEPSNVTEIASPGLMFRCTSCDAATHTRSGLAKHTDAAHRRGLKGDEHVARAS